MSQRETVLRMLKRAGRGGVRSDAFFEAHLPRAAARILELRDQGYEISSEREGKFVRYCLVGEAANGKTRPSQEARGVPENRSVGGLSSEAVKRSVPSCFDADVEWP